MPRQRPNRSDAVGPPFHVEIGQLPRSDVLVARASVVGPPASVRDRRWRNVRPGAWASAGLSWNSVERAEVSRGNRSGQERRSRRLFSEIRCFFQAFLTVDGARETAFAASSTETSNPN